MTEPTSMPYGGVINWAISPGRSVHDRVAHHGYYHLVAWRVYEGSHAYYTAEQCALAREQDAPKNAIYLSGSSGTPGEERVWHTFDGLPESNPDLAEAVERYVQAMKRLEGRRKAQK